MIGGADGLPLELRRLPKLRPGEPQGLALLALGRLTLPHRLVRVLLLEQLYRAREIRRGSSYHRGEPKSRSNWRPFWLQDWPARERVGPACCFPPQPQRLSH